MMTHLVSSAASNSLQQQAAQYISRLYSGNLTEAEASDIENWLTQSPLNRQIFEELLVIWDLSLPLADETDLCPLNARNETNLRQRSNWSHWLLASGLLLMILLPFYQLYAPEPDPVSGSSIATAHFETAIGEQRTITLPDGSIVTLNTNSSLTTDFSLAERRVTLHKGEAFFDIAHNAKSTFTVDTGSQSISVLGTKFNVHRTGPEFTLAVVSGIVAVHNKGEPLRVNYDKQSTSPNPAQVITRVANQYRLSAGAVVTFKDHTKLLQQKVEADVQRYQDWRSGVVTFDKAPLTDVVTQLNRYSTKRVLIQDASIMALPISGVFHLTEMDTLLAGLEAALPISVDYIDDVISISAKQPD